MKMSNNPAKYKVISKQYLRSIMDISEKMTKALKATFHDMLEYAKGLT